MPGGSNLSVKITADVVELQTKFAIARAEVSGLTTEMNKLARASAAGTIDAAGSAKLTQLAGDMLHARSEAAGYASALEKAGVSATGFASRLEGGEISVTRSARAMRELVDGLGRGNIGTADIALLHLGHSLLGLGPAALAGVGAVAALTGGLGYLAYSSIEAAAGLSRIETAARFAGNLDLPREQITRLTEELRKSGTASEATARTLIGTFAAIPGVTAPVVESLSLMAAQLAHIRGEDPGKAAESLAKLFAPGVTAGGAASELSKITQLTQEQLNLAAQADRTGDANAIAASKLSLLTAALSRVRDVTVASVPALREYAAAAGGAVDYGNYASVQAAALERIHKLNQERLETQLRVNAAVAATPAPREQTLKAGVATADKENPVTQQIEEAKAKIEQMTAALAIAKGEADQTDFAKLTASLAKAREELTALQFGPVVERMRADMAQLAASWDGTQSGLLAKQQQVAAAALKTTQAGSKEYLAIQTEVAHLEVQARQSAGEEIIANARTSISAINAQTSLGATERLTAEREVWAQLLAGTRLTASQRLDAEREFNNASANLAREQATQASTIARQDASADIAISRLAIEARRSALDEDVTATQAAAARKLEALRTLTAQEYALNLQELEAELDGLRSQPAEYDRVYNQIRELKAKLVADLAGLDHQYQADASRYGAEQVREWRKAIDEIEGAESSLVGDVLSRRKTLSQSLLSIAQQTVQKEITNDIQAMTTRLLLANTEEARKRAIEQSGYLYHMLFARQMTAATITSQSAQTSATIAGNTARLTSTASASAAGKAIHSATAGKSVISDAAQAFSGTYASVSKIPYVGWILAPIAAAGAFAAVAGYESLASLDVGAWNVPRDMVANIHAGETVLPVPFAQAFRSAAAGGDEEGGGSGDTHNHYWNVNTPDAASFKKMISQLGHRDAIVGVLRDHFHSRAR